MQPPSCGYILKDSGPAELVQAIHQVYRGEPSLEPLIALEMLQELSHPPQRLPTPDPLSERGMEVLRLLAQGKSNREITDQLVITELTARTHVNNILGKLHLANCSQASEYALKEGLASLDDVPANMGSAFPEPYLYHKCSTLLILWAWERAACGRSFSSSPESRALTMTAR
jgi:DNA-binding CsgD family transcriptional regulator